MINLISNHEKGVNSCDVVTSARPFNLFKCLSLKKLDEINVIRKLFLSFAPFFKFALSIFDKSSC